MTAEELPDCITPVSADEMYLALAHAWLDYFGTQPTPAALCVLVAQWALETAWGKSMHCYNVGNIKSGELDGRCWTYFPCGEELPEPTASRLVSHAPGHVRIAREYQKHHGETWETWCSVKFLPKHPYSRFRAYRTLDEGVRDYIVMVRYRFARAWPAVINGDPHLFSHLLKQAGYYTASEQQYSAGLVAIHNKLMRALEHQELPVLSAADEAEIKALTAISLDALAREELSRK